MNGGARTRFVILGGGFGGIYAALRLEKALARGAALEVTLINRENFFLGLRGIVWVKTGGGGGGHPLWARPEGLTRGRGNRA